MKSVHLMTLCELATAFDMMAARAARSNQFLFQFAPAFTAAWLARNAELRGAF